MPGTRIDYALELGQSRAREIINERLLDPATVVTTDGLGCILWGGEYKQLWIWSGLSQEKLEFLEDGKRGADRLPNTHSCLRGKDRSRC